MKDSENEGNLNLNLLENNNDFTTNNNSLKYPKNKQSDSFTILKKSQSSVCVSDKKKVFSSKRNLTSRHQRHQSRRNGLNQFHIIQTLPDNGKDKSCENHHSKPNAYNKLSYFKKLKFDDDLRFTPGLKKKIKTARQLGN